MDDKTRTPPVLLPLDPAALPVLQDAVYDAIVRAEREERWHEADHLRSAWEAMCPYVPSGALVFRSEVWAEIMSQARLSDGAWQVRHQLRQVRPGARPQGPLAVRIDGRTWQTEVDYRRGTPMLQALGAAMRLCAPPPGARGPVACRAGAETPEVERAAPVPAMAS